MTNSLASQGPPAPIRPIMCGLFHPAETSEQWIPGGCGAGGELAIAWAFKRKPLHCVSLQSWALQTRCGGETSTFSEVQGGPFSEILSSLF